MVLDAFSSEQTGRASKFFSESNFGRWLFSKQLSIKSPFQIYNSAHSEWKTLGQTRWSGHGPWSFSFPRYTSQLREILFGHRLGHAHCCLRRLWLPFTSGHTSLRYDAETPGRVSRPQRRTSSTLRRGPQMAHASSIRRPTQKSTGQQYLQHLSLTFKKLV